MKPLKKFGQNYLTDNNIVNKIIDHFNPLKNDTVIEIGPGTGALTKLLAGRVNNFTAIEIDTRVIDIIKESLPEIKLINADFLDTDLTEFAHEKKIRIIGNIPYNITSPIIFKLIENRQIINDALLMVQYEVAKRITSHKGTKDYGILSVLLNYFAETRLEFKISPNVFYPKPKVWSAIIKINFNKQTHTQIEDSFFIKVVKASFRNRRKTLKNSLSNSIFGGIKLDQDKLRLKRRAEELSVDDFIELSTKIKEQLNGRRN